MVDGCEDKVNNRHRSDVYQEQSQERRRKRSQKSLVKKKHKRAFLRTTSSTYDELFEVQVRIEAC